MTGGREMHTRSARDQETCHNATVASAIGLLDSSLAVRPTVDEPSTCSYEEKLAALQHIADEGRGLLIGMALRMTANRDDAEDIVQEALLRAFKNLPQFRRESKMATWLCVIVQNIGRERLRKHKGVVSISLGHDRATGDDPAVFDLPDPGRTPEQLCERREMENILLSEIERMNSVCKSTIQMCALEELPHIEVANALGVSLFNVKSRLFNGRRMLRRALQLRIGV